MAGYALGRLLPLQETVVLASADAADLKGNLAYIHRELLRRPGVRVRVVAHPIPTTGSARLRALVQLIAAGYLLARSRVHVLDAYYFPLFVIPRRRHTLVAQTWHGCGAFKKFGYSVLDKSFGADEAYVRQVPIHRNYDLCLVSAMRFAPFFAEAFREPLSMFVSRYGIPRTDVFFDLETGQTIREQVRQRYAIPAGRRVALFAPTFRGESLARARSADDLDLELLHDRLGDDHVVLVRAHPVVRERIAIDPALTGFAIDVSDYPDINELMLVSDVLVTDYSSAIYEFALLGRPMAFFAPDHDAYEAERGFYFDYRTGLPGPIFETTEALATWLRAGVFDLERIQRFRAEAFDVADGHATQRFVDEVVLPALSRS